MAKKISFTVTEPDRQTIAAIVDRYAAMAEDAEISFDRLSCTMDITACHANGNPLNLKALLDATAFSFMHDVSGIVHNLDRDTGELTSFFLPRHSA